MSGYEEKDMDCMVMLLYPPITTITQAGDPSYDPVIRLILSLSPKRSPLNAVDTIARSISLQSLNVP